MIIGNKKYKYKKDALAYYKEILNSYDYEESLSDEHYSDLVDLYNINCIEPSSDSEESDEENDLFIKDIQVAKVQYNTKCFQIIWSDLDTVYISYIQLINQHKFNPRSNFNAVCRHTIQKDLISVKQKYFSKHSFKGHVKCQETQENVKWEELVIDHRQPNTLSVIVDRFIELNNININKIEYNIDSNNIQQFEDIALARSFREYHKDKANLRIVTKECNSKRASQGRISQSNKDLKIQ